MIIRIKPFSVQAGRDFPTGKDFNTSLKAGLEIDPLNKTQGKQVLFPTIYKSIAKIGAIRTECILVI